MYVCVSKQVSCLMCTYLLLQSAVFILTFTEASHSDKVVPEAPDFCLEGLFPGQVILKTSLGKAAYLALELDQGYVIA